MIIQTTHRPFLATLLFVLGSVFIGAQAQTWCPPGAVWEYNWSGGASTGCQVRTYVADTVIDGFDCQRIEVIDIFYDFISDEVDTIESLFHTRFENGVVFQQIGVDLYWDTLYWFTAPVGSRWYPPGVGDGCGGLAGMVEVLSIQEQVVNGLGLEVRTLGQLGEDGMVMFEGPDMIERLGTALMSIPHTCLFGDGFGSIVRYRDDLWEGFDSGETSNCDRFPNSLRELQGAQLHGLSFGADGRSLTIQAPGGSGGLYAMHDLRGKTIQQGRYSGGGTPIGVGDLVPAMYLIRLTTSTGLQEVVKFQIP